ncbi:membrane-associated progesterone receptor component 2 [Alligator mississippiensis]|uniref:Membrane-associated progesterone receptor component 2 n=1 Tax=Alligator mississippiensis TaxID=8496 RepID=A0A151PED2_ALLMI|nr:membrane-associated progesterone receptor component 2 [Alligator mississippiensis]KYO47362.1 membrane-associated progesterone receptor component 2 [Alligator mississippiensis]
MMADDGDGQLRTEGSDGLGAAGAEEETAAGEGWVAGGEMLLSVGLLALALLAAYGLYVRWGRRSGPGAAAQQNQAAAVPRMKRRDFTLEQLREFDGARKPNILLAVNGKVFDVTNGSKFYGPEGPYGIFAGRDASRGLATFCLDKDALRDEYDDLSDLNAVQMESVREWEMQFKEKYDYVGRLLKPGEEPSEYTDEEDTKDHTKQD